MTQDDIQAAVAEASKLVNPMARWTPGAWTPARCALWRSFDAEQRTRLERWVAAEQERGTHHKTQLPEKFAP